MKSTAKELVLSILTRIKELDASASKTKLLKLLYLADIEHFRTTGETLTGFAWIFYWYGPWSSDYDQLLDQMEAEAVLARNQWAAGNLDGERLSAIESRDLGKTIANTNEYFRIRHLVDTFAALATSELLDFVYFDTEPMVGAEKGKRLDFGKISREAPQFYRRPTSGSSSGRIRELKTKFREVKERISQESDANTRQFCSPSYDEHYWTAMEAFDKSGDE
ncbi:MAG: type II toxin-antitoxin system antitoxin SocA domain-containing protein [Candidatus Korobacteraceae bacterium]